MTSRWSEGGGPDATAYAERFARLAASGQDVHGEARFCAALVDPGSRVLDAGCGTGRVAIRLAELGYDVVGVDLDESMLAVARAQRPDLAWVLADLATLDLGIAPQDRFALAVMAGNILPLAAAGTEPAVVARLAEHLRPGGLLVTGYGLSRDHLPPAGAVLPLAEFDRWCADAGLTLDRRFATWDAEPYQDDAGYAVSVHRR